MKKRRFTIAFEGALIFDSETIAEAEKQSWEVFKKIAQIFEQTNTKNIMTIAEIQERKS